MIDKKQFSQDESKYPWLCILLDTYDISDKCMSKHLAALLLTQGASISCQKGCHSCCINMSVPITQLELMGISWYVVEKIKGDLRQKVKSRLYTHNDYTECPFLIDSCCSIYPVRPLICRQFYIKSKPCAVNEDILNTRSHDIIHSGREIAKKVSMRILDYYGFIDEQQKAIAFEQGFIVQNSRPMHTIDWATYGQIMDKVNNKI